MLCPIYLSVGIGDIGYCPRSCSGHGRVIINMRQHIKFAVSNPAPIAHFSKRSEDPPWHNVLNRTNIAEFEPVSTKIRFTMVQIYNEIAITNQNFVVFGPKIVETLPIVPIMTFYVSRVLAEFGFMDPIGHSKCDILLIVFRLCTITAVLASDIWYL